MAQRRILLIGKPKSGKLTLLKALTGSLPPNIDAQKHSGISHTYKIHTQYYTSDICVWVDEINDITDWTNCYLDKEAQEVLQVLGAFIYTFRKPLNDAELKILEADLALLHKVIKACGYHWDGVCLAVAMPVNGAAPLERPYDDWDDLCRPYQFEYVDYEAKGTNDYGEPQGMKRIKEALEANDWTGDVGGLDDQLLDDLGDDEDEGVNGDEEGNITGGLKLEVDEMEKEMFGLHQAVLGSEDQVTSTNEEETGVEQLDKALRKLQIIRDMKGEVPEVERRKMASKAIAEIVKTI